MHPQQPIESQQIPSATLKERGRPAHNARRITTQLLPSSIKDPLGKPGKIHSEGGRILVLESTRPARRVKNNRCQNNLGKAAWRAAVATIENRCESSRSRPISAFSGALFL
jgi:hypothetical protein